MNNETIIGQSPTRVGGVERVTGAQRYAADIRLDNVLHVKLVSLPCARAAMRGIERSRAASIPGVRAILTAADLPQPVPRYGPVFADRPVLATGETKFFGEPVAAVAAETWTPPRRPPRWLSVDYEELPAVLSVEQRARPLVAARPGPGPAQARAAHPLEHPGGLDVRLGRRRGRQRGLRHRARLQLPDGDALRHRAARLPRRARRERRHHLESDPASVRPAARRGGGAEVAAVARPHRRAGSRRRVRRQGLAEVRAVDGVSRAGHRPARAAGADARGDVSGGAADVGARSTRAPASIATGRIVFQDLARGLPDRRLRRHRRARRQQGQLRGVRPLQDAARARRRARAAVAHHAEHRIPRLRHAAGVVGGRIAARRSGAHARHRPRRDPAPQPAGQRAKRSSRTTRRRMATGRPRSIARPSEAIGWGTPLPPTARPRHLARPEELVDGVRVARACARMHFDGSVIDAVRHVGHGPGRAHGVRADCRRGARHHAWIASRS